MDPIQITVFTGFLGSGKTTTILSVLSQLPKDYKVVLLKNEYGDVEVDSKIAEQASITAVSEILNGCMCCILVGQMKNALLDIRDKYRPDRVIIESSGSALPATLALQIRQLEGDYPGDFKLDSIITVVDAENFAGYDDESPTAKMQAKFCDVLLINKWEHVSERQLDIVMDHLYTLNDLTPKLRCNGREGVSSDLLFGLDTKLYSLSLDDEAESEEGKGTTHMDEEVETCTIGRLKDGPIQEGENPHEHGGDGCSTPPPDCDGGPCQPPPVLITRQVLEEALAKLPKESIYRVKGFVSLFIPPRERKADRRMQVHILNWAFGRFDLIPIDSSVSPSDPSEVASSNDLRLTIMGERGEVKRWAGMLGSALAVHYLRYRH